MADFAHIYVILGLINIFVKNRNWNPRVNMASDQQYTWQQNIFWKVVDVNDWHVNKWENIKLFRVNNAYNKNL